jgi:hypothetical protein
VSEVSLHYLPVKIFCKININYRFGLRSCTLMVIKEFTRRRIEKDKNHKRGRNRMENSPHETIHEKFYIFL